MSDSQTIWKIIKESCKKCFETETSTESGRINLVGTLICAAIVVTAMASELVDKAIWCFNNSYELGIPWYAVVALVAMLLIQISYCVSRVSKINDIDRSIDKQ